MCGEDRVHVNRIVNQIVRRNCVPNAGINFGPYLVAPPANPELSEPRGLERRETEQIVARGRDIRMWVVGGRGR